MPVKQPTSLKSGPTYSITGHAEKFKLPSTRVLKPGMEHNPGRLDSWPVHALNPAHSNLSMARNSSLYSSQPHNTSATNALTKPSMQPKPKFLEELESYLSKELRLLGCPSSGPHELRLQAYREVFEYLIEDFKTYKGLLSSIKNEYELYMNYQDEVIKELKPMRTMLETMREECERRILEVKREEKREEAEVRQENKRLISVIDKMKSEELSYQSQIDKLQEEMAELYKNYRLECDARKILVSEYNDLKFRQQEQKTEDDGNADQGEDPVVLKLKLIRAREDLRACNQRINTMLADYGDVVPRREFEMMETTCRNLEVETEKLKTDHGALMEEHTTLQDLYKGVQSQRDRLSNELTDLKRSATPRPDWKRCGLYIEGGHERWSELSEGRSSDRMLNILLAQMSGMDESEVAKGDPFTGEGKENDVPRYLRTEGMVKNRKIDLKEVNELINGFWHHRLQNSVQDSFPLDEDLFYFLLSRNENNEELAIEDGYNLRDACLHNGHKTHVTLFKQVIEGELEENVFHYWLHLQTTLTEEFSKQQVGHGVVNASTLPKLLDTTLPGKSAENIKVLSDSAVQLATVGPDSVGFVNLFTPDDNGSPSEFAVLLLQQYLAECEEFVNQLAHEIQGQDIVSLSEVQTVLHKIVNDSKNYEDQLLLLARAFSVSLEVISEDKSGLRDITAPTTQLLEQLKKLGVSKSAL